MPFKQCYCYESTIIKLALIGQCLPQLQEEGHPPVALAGDASGGNLADLLSGGGLVPGMAAAPASGSDEQCSLM